MNQEQYRNLLSKIEQKDKAGTDVYPALAIGSGFMPSAGISDVLGYAPDPLKKGKTLPSFSENIASGKYLDAGLQTIGASGDVMLAASPMFPPLLLPAVAAKTISTGGKALKKALDLGALPKKTETAKLGALPEKSTIQKIQTLKSDFNNTTSETQKAKIAEQISVLKNQRQQEVEQIRKEANIDRFGYDPNEKVKEVETSYRLEYHQARGPNEANPVRLDDLTIDTKGNQAGYPENFYSSEGQRIYAPKPRFANDEFGIANDESYKKIIAMRGKPDAEVTIYRAVPNDPKITTINTGDFITLSKKYAEMHGASGYDNLKINREFNIPQGKPLTKILEKKVKVKDVYWDQNDVNEFGYFPQKNKETETLGALPKQTNNFNILRKDASIQIDNPAGKDAITNETYVQKKIRQNNEYKQNNPNSGPIGLYEGITGRANNIKFNPEELINIKGEMGEEVFRMSGNAGKEMANKLQALKKSIKKDGYKPTNIKITVTEDGTPYITEGNHRLAEALQSKRPEIIADISYLRGGETADGILNPKKIGIQPNKETETLGALPKQTNKVTD